MRATLRVDGDLLVVCESPSDGALTLSERSLTHFCESRLQPSRFALRTCRAGTRILVPAHLLGLTMRKVSIAKGNGSFRLIYVPDRQEKAASHAIAGRVAQLADKACPDSVCHGFTSGRSAVTNASSHVGHAFTLVMDLASFFDSVTEVQLKGKVPNEFLQTLLYEGAARQGLPASPAAANLAAAPMDRAILRVLAKRKAQVVYTRYADDMSFSFDDAAIAEWLPGQVAQAASRCGFKIADHKTRLYRAAAGRRIITGIGVGDTKLYPTRATKRKLRAAKHQAQFDTMMKLRAAGLAEWCKLKKPVGRSRELIVGPELLDQVKRLARVWSLGNIQADNLPDKGGDLDIGGNCIITGDPCYMLGMSTFTTGWTSCHSQPTGVYRRGAVFWTHVRGTRVACLQSSQVGTYGGVSRRLMKARALVHKLRNGVLVYDRIYGGDTDRAILRERLESQAIIPMVEAKKKYKGQRVEGHAPFGWKAYFDNLRTVRSKAAAGPWAGKEVRVCMI